jgi:hypothetical protein
MINIKSLLGLDYYTSELDQFLTEFSKKHPKLTPNQRKEVQKYERVYRLRDDPQYVEHKSTFWANF